MLKTLSAGMMLVLASWSSVAQENLPVIELTAGFHRIEAEVAARDDQRQTGLMNRRAMPAQRGMLFAFPVANTYCMWMRNTFIPLSVAFMDENGVIINIEDMAPHSEDNHCARRPASYALEMNKGWFAQRGVVAGARLKGLERAPRAR